jgi:hypothetical protein
MSFTRDVPVVVPRVMLESLAGSAAIRETLYLRNSIQVPVSPRLTVAPGIAAAWSASA